MQPSVLIALPCYGGIMSAMTSKSLIELGKLLSNSRISHDFLFVTNQSLIPKARSDISNYFLNATTFDYIIWIDSDIQFSMDDFIALYEMNEQHVMGTYRHKIQEVRYSFTIDQTKNPWHPDFPSAIKIIQNVGGFSIVHRSVYEAIQKNIPQLKYNPASNSRLVTEAEMNNSYHYYDIPIDQDSGILLPEDFAFQKKCTEAGIDMWLRTDVQLGHNGNTTFMNNNLYEILSKEIPHE